MNRSRINISRGEKSWYPVRRWGVFIDDESRMRPEEAGDVRVDSRVTQRINHGETKVRTRVKMEICGT